MLLGDSASSLLLLSSSPDARVPGTPGSHEPSPRAHRTSSLWSAQRSPSKCHPTLRRPFPCSASNSSLLSASSVVSHSQLHQQPFGGGNDDKNDDNCDTADGTVDAALDASRGHAVESCLVAPSLGRSSPVRVVPEIGDERRVVRGVAVLDAVPGGIEGIMALKRGVTPCPRCGTPAGSLAASGCAVCVVAWAAHSPLVVSGHPSAALLFRSLILTGFTDTSSAAPVRFAAAVTSLAELHVRLGSPEPSLALGALSLWRALESMVDLYVGTTTTTTQATAASPPAGASTTESYVCSMRQWVREAAQWAQSVSVQGSLPDETEAAGILAALRG